MAKLLINCSNFIMRGYTYDDIHTAAKRVLSQSMYYTDNKSDGWVFGRKDIGDITFIDFGDVVDLYNRCNEFIAIVPDASLSCKITWTL